MGPGPAHRGFTQPVSGAYSSPAARLAVQDVSEEQSAGWGFHRGGKGRVKLCSSVLLRPQVCCSPDSSASPRALSEGSFPEGDVPVLTYDEG